MPVRRYKVKLELFEEAIFYHWNYDPPVKNIGGGSGCVIPGESMGSVSYETLHKLGSGIHGIQFDETIRDKYRSPSRELETEDDRLFRQLRFELFNYGVASCTESDVFCAILLAMTPRNLQRILPLLNTSQVAELRDYAREIQADEIERAKQELHIFSNAGSMPIPDKNLVTIREYFG